MHSCFTVSPCALVAGNLFLYHGTHVLAVARDTLQLHNHERFPLSICLEIISDEMIDFWVNMDSNYVAKCTAVIHKSSSMADVREQFYSELSHVNARV